MKDIIIRYIIPTLLLILMLMSPIGDRLQSVFDNTILPYLDYPSNGWLTALAILILFLACWHNSERFKAKKLISKNWLFALGYCNIIIILFWIKDSYNYVPMFEFAPFLTYTLCILIVGFIYLIVTVINFIRSRAKFVRESPVVLNPGKPVNQEEINEDYEYTDYIKSIAPIIIDNFDEQVSVSVGISGAWGSGKTSFLHALQKQIEQDKRVASKDRVLFEFKPWFCEKKTDLVQEFFKVYREHMGKRISGFDSDIIEYAKVLTENVDKLKWMNQVMKLCTPTESIQKQFDTITDKLSKYKIAVYIIIDDLDRLDGEEIMEILRLIRITANFPYTQFILTYDKPYIQKAIKKQLDYDDSERFIDKIINTEISLPHFNNYAIGNMLYNELAAYCDDVKVLRSELLNWKPLPGKNLESSFASIIISILPTFRDVHRFVNMIKLDFDKLKGNQQEIDFRDFFMLSLIKYAYPGFYKLMYSQPNDLFKIGTLKVYMVDKPTSNNQKPNPGSLDNKNKRYEKYRKLLEEHSTPHSSEIIELLLFKLFVEERDDMHLIRIANNYYKYFQFKTPVYQYDVSNFLKGIYDNNLAYIEEKKNKVLAGELERMMIICFNNCMQYDESQRNSEISKLIEFSDMLLSQTYIDKKEVFRSFDFYLKLENSFNKALWIKIISTLIKHDIKGEWHDLIGSLLSNKSGDNSTYKSDVRKLLSSSDDPYIIYSLYHSVTKEMYNQNLFVFNDEEVVQIQLEVLKNVLQTSIQMKDKIYIIEFLPDRTLVNKNGSFIPDEEAKRLIRNYLINNSSEFIEHFINKVKSNSEYGTGVKPMPDSKWVLSRTDIEFIFMKEKGNNVANYDNGLRLWNWIKKTGEESYPYEDPNRTKTVDQWIAEGMPGLE